ncbi:MAG: hypothetical protein M0T84_07160 [Betaproteobacteria bacterium]|nr:hypothetical protein [Betaproteobacteria bacterium]
MNDDVSLALGVPNIDAWHNAELECPTFKTCGIERAVLDTLSDVKEHILSGDLDGARHELNRVKFLVDRNDRETKRKTLGVYPKWVVVACAGTEDENIVAAFAHAPDAREFVCKNAQDNLDVMKRLPDDTLTTEF